MHRVVLLGTACLALAACASSDQSQIGPDRYRIATGSPVMSYDQAAERLDAKAVELCPDGHYVVSEETGSIAFGVSYARVVRCVDLTGVKRPMPRPPGGP
ncbi:MAG: hypothetical protein AB7G39_09270 [Alphaproteobacteria bacterium]